MTMKNHGFICGRFQPVHFGHFEFVDHAANKVDKLFIGITNPYPNAFNYSKNDKQRCRPESNLFSYEERKKMIDDLSTEYLKDRNIEVIPCDLNKLNAIISGLPNDVILMHTIYDNWGDEKLNLFKNTNKEIEILWERQDKITRATDVRYNIVNGRDWCHLVPTTTQTQILQIGVEEIKRRFKEANGFLDEIKTIK